MRPSPSAIASPSRLGRRRRVGPKTRLADKVTFCVRGVVSPLLSNIFLHYAIDVWFAERVRPRLRAVGTLVRFCDDLVMLFGHRVDAERVLAVLGKRLERFGLQLHP